MEPSPATTLARYAAARTADRRYHQLGRAIARAARRHDVAAVKRLAAEAEAQRQAWQQLVKGA